MHFHAPVHTEMWSAFFFKVPVYDKIYPSENI